MADDSDSSGLSEHSDKEIQRLAPIFIKAKKATKNAAPPPVQSPPRRKRSPSPPHEEVLADSQDIAFIVMFRSRFNEAFHSRLPHFGPQDIERGIVESVPTQQVEHLLCALLGLVLNRKKPVERGHHGRALEEAVQSQKSQWPHSWGGHNPLHGGNNFQNMSPPQRLNLLRTLVMWSLSSSEAIQTIIKEKYKQNRHNDDENQPLSVQPWGVDGEKRRYFLIQGLDDTSFRVYREGGRYTKTPHWWNCAGSIEEVKALAKKIEDHDDGQAARRFASRIYNAVPTFEATEEKRRRREYRQIRRAAFTRPEPGFSLYEGRTRGKRMRYTYEDDELSDETSTRRSTRQSERNTPLESGPTVTASGRQVKQPKTGDYGESLLSAAQTSADETNFDYDSGDENDGAGESGHLGKDGRSTRFSGRSGVNVTNGSRKRKHIDGYNDIDDMSNEDDADSLQDWESDKDEADDEIMPNADDEGEELSENEEEEEQEDDEQQSLVVKLKLGSQPKVLDDGDSKCAAIEQERIMNDHIGMKSEEAATTSSTLAPNGTTRYNDQPISSPAAPPGYPTPSSSSFVLAEQKAVLADGPVVGGDVSAQGYKNAPAFANGILAEVNGE